MEAIMTSFTFQVRHCVCLDTQYAVAYWAWFNAVELLVHILLP